MTSGMAIGEIVAVFWNGTFLLLLLLACCYESNNFPISGDSNSRSTGRRTQSHARSVGASGLCRSASSARPDGEFDLATVIEGGGKWSNVGVSLTGSKTLSEPAASPLNDLSRSFNLPVPVLADQCRGEAASSSVSCGGAAINCKHERGGEARGGNSLPGGRTARSLAAGKTLR